jgi:hypothetical protein
MNNHHIHHLIVLLACLSLTFSHSYAGTQTPKYSDKITYLTGIIESIDYDNNLLKFYGVTYHYSSSTTITMEGHGKATELNLTPGARVRLRRKPIVMKRGERSYMLSEIIIREP